jgi:hypothetical protein
MTLPCHLVYPCEANITIEWLYLVMHDYDRSQVVGIAHDRAPSHDGGPMWLFLLGNRKLHESETGRGK